LQEPFWAQSELQETITFTSFVGIDSFAGLVGRWGEKGFGGQILYPIIASDK
jgi:hypothetical protein